MNEKPYGHLYVILNSVNDKIYIGQTIQNPPTRRWIGHKFRAGVARGASYPSAIHDAMREYGINNFQFNVVMACRSKQELDDCEQILIKAWNTRSPNGYNLLSGGDAGGKHSEETKAKMSQSARNRAPASEATRAKIANIVKQRVVSPETRAKMSIAFKSRHVGRRHSEETKAKMSAARKGKIRGPYGPNKRTKDKVIKIAREAYE